MYILTRLTDVKPDNILVREPHSDPSERTEPFAPIAFLADFGTASWDVCSTVRRDPSLGCDGTAVYTSPECWVLGESQRAPADMWAMGMALLSRWLGYHPLDDFLGRDRSTRGARFCLLMLKEGWLEEAGFLEGMSRDSTSSLMCSPFVVLAPFFSQFEIFISSSSIDIYIYQKNHTPTSPLDKILSIPYHTYMILITPSTQ